MESKAKAPGLTWPRGKPIWRASRPAIEAGFTPKWVNLACFANDETALIARCQRLTAEMHDWVSGKRGRDPVFDGTIGSLIRIYQVEPSSPYHRLAPSSRHPYDAYIRMIVKTVGARRIDALDGRDLSRWHAEYRCAERAGIKATVWNRDLRAAGVTEARQAAAPTDDVAKVAGHANKRTTAKVYDRDRLEAQRRVMKARIAHRAKDDER